MTRGVWLVLFGLALPGCGLPQCEALCAREAGCAEAELEAYGATWEEFTGFEDRAAYEASCMAIFEDSHAQGSSRGELHQVCQEEMRKDPCAQ